MCKRNDPENQDVVKSTLQVVDFGELSLRLKNQQKDCVECVMEGRGAEPWHWRQAMQIAAQVPPDEQDAWAVLDCVVEILKLSFRGAPEPAPPIAPGSDQASDQLLAFPAGGSKTPRRRATSIGSPSGLEK
jgi:hypothetical protein